ncbi:MAG TPA: hypothetical protein VEI25_15525 [Paraburkholderia sp.]|nr:hypothetical protein [Paraburkholderia sp.]
MARRIVRGAVLVCLALAAACGQPGHTADEGNSMKASTTYLYLLRKTPFFTSLDTRQLRWTIEHSREWEAEAGTTLATCGPGQQEQDHDGDFWVLLDGRWQVEHDGHSYPSGHADAGKWFSTSDARGDCRLVVTEHSYVMKITRADMDDMLARGFAFDGHLQQGRAYYGTIFATGVRAEVRN